MKPPKTQAPSNLSFVIRFVHCEKYCESLIISIDSKWENWFESIYSCIYWSVSMRVFYWQLYDQRHRHQKQLSNDLKNGDIDRGGVEKVFLQLEVERLTVLRTSTVSHSAALLHLKLIFVRKYFNICVDKLLSYCIYLDNLCRPAEADFHKGIWGKVLLLSSGPARQGTIN